MHVRFAVRRRNHRTIDVGDRREEKKNKSVRIASRPGGVLDFNLQIKNRVARMPCAGFGRAPRRNGILVNPPSRRGRGASPSGPTKMPGGPAGLSGYRPVDPTSCPMTRTRARRIAPQACATIGGWVSASVVGKAGTARCSNFFTI